jgi:membrane protease YdiL (CAAX protease family)
MEPVEAALAQPQPPVIEKPEFKPLASYLHTVIVVGLMIGVGVMSAISFQQGKAPTDPIALYIPTIIWLWSLAAIVYAGIRYRGNTLRDTFGRTWKYFDDALMDFSVAAGFWVAVFALLIVLAYSFNAIHTKITGTPTPTTIPAELNALTPRGPAGYILWIVLSFTAGFCEEYVFRGYLQKQFIALTKSVGGGIVLSALIFSVGHLYEGAVKAAVIGIFGVTLGLLTHYRRSLAPAIIVHVWHDLFAGLLLVLLPHLQKLVKQP